MRSSSCVAFGAVLGLSLSTRPAHAQLAEGTFLAQTFEMPGCPGNTLQVVDPFAGTAVPLSIAGLPACNVLVPGPIQSSTSFLLGAALASTFGGNAAVFGASWSAASGWTATQLSTGPFVSPGAIIVVPGQIVLLGGWVYVIGPPAVTTGGAGAYVFRLPAAGGAPALYANLTAAGAQGIGSSMTAVGTTLHAFTFDSTAAGPDAQHWTIDTTTAPPTIALVGPLPDSLTPLTPPRNFATQQAGWDPVSGNLVIAGLYGDVLWRTPTGTNLNQFLSPGISGCTPFGIRHDGLAVNSNTGAIGLGDGCGHYDELRCSGAQFLDDLVLITAPPAAASTLVWRLSYFPHPTANCREDGAGCAGSSGLAPCNYVNSLPTSPNAAFAITLSNALPAAPCLLVIGASDAAWGPVALPFDLAALGAPGCFLRTSVDIAVSAVASPSGSASVPLPIPAGLAGTAYSQWIVLDPLANAFGFAFSDGRRIDI